jgi:Flp pilus assembly protein TadG
MVEFAIVLPLLFTLVFGIIEFGILLYNKAMVTNASREGARLGILYSYPDPIPVTDIQNKVLAYCSGNMITFGTAANPTTTVSGQCDAAGDPLTVNVTYPYKFLVLPNFVTSLTGTINVAAQTIMRCE